MSIQPMSAVYLHKYLLDTLEAGISNSNDLCVLDASRVNTKELIELQKKLKINMSSSDDWKWDSILATELPKLERTVREEVSKRG